MKFATKAVHAGISPDPTTGAIIPPIYQTATYTLEQVGENKGFDYTRGKNPTRKVLEDNLAALEGGEYAISFASGMATVDAILRLFQSGDHIISNDDVYGGVIRLFDTILVNFGLEFSYVDTTDPENLAEAIKPNTKMIWVETPTNPLLKVTDLEAVATIAKANNLLMGVDTTFATPYLLRPLEWGIDFVVHSTTKYLSGHNQIIGGAVVTNNEELYERLRFVQKTTGAASSPFDCWLTLLGIKTLPLRMDKHCANGMAIAQYLESHPKVTRVNYPGLESNVNHHIAKVQMKGGYSGMMSFDLEGGLEAGRTLMNSVRLCSLAESLGAVETMVTHPATMTHGSVPREDRIARGLTDGLVRVSAGIEDIDDILEDFEQALAKV